MNYLPIIESEEMDLIMQLFFHTSPIIMNGNYANDDPEIIYEPNQFKKWIRGDLTWKHLANRNTFNNIRIEANTVTKDKGFRINWRRWGQGDWYTWPTRSDLEGMYDRHKTISKRLRNAWREPALKGIPLGPIEWKNKNVDFRNINTNLVSLNNFKNGNKAIKFKATNKNVYISPNSFVGLARKSMKAAYTMNSNAIVFKNPITRENVRRGDIEFVILKKRYI